MFCTQCGTARNNSDKYCNVCGKDFVNVKEPESKDKSVKTPAVKSFSHYQYTKGKQWKLKVSKNTENKVPKEVFINIGLMQWCSQEHCFKAKRGKKIVLRVEPEATYISLLIEAESKWKHFHKNLYNRDQTYLLLYEDGSKAEYMPGSENDLFTLKKYHDEVRKDYKRITLYLATDEDFQLSTDEGNASQDSLASKESDSDDEKLSHSPFENSGSDKKQCTLKSKQPRSTSTSSSAIDLTIEPPSKCKASTSFTSLQSQLDNTVELDDDLAIQLQEIFDGECSNNLTMNLDDASQESVMQSINLNVDTSGQFFVVIRRGADVYRKLSIWRREAKKSVSGSHPLRISYVGEQGIDTGAMSKEFFTETVAEIGSTFFPNGCPVDSTFHIQNGNLRTCGKIVASSLAQGGPAPHFMDEGAYNLMINPNVDLQKLDKDRHLTEYDRNLLQSVRDDIVSNTDTIIDCGYTGPIDKEHIEEIVNSIIVSIVSKRLMCLQEFVEGLNQFGVAPSIRLFPNIFKVLFTLESQPTAKVDANYIFSVLAPQYSMIGSTRRKIEETLMDSFQDLLFSLEDGNNIPSYEEAIVFDASTESSADQYQVADTSVPGVMGWLTGQKHRPINGEKLVITVIFNHDCLQQNPEHKLCFPVVSACAKEITFPVEHMKTPSTFKEVFMIALCKGQSFARV